MTKTTTNSITKDELAILEREVKPAKLHHRDRAKEADELADRQEAQEVGLDSGASFWQVSGAEMLLTDSVDPGLIRTRHRTLVGRLLDRFLPYRRQRKALERLIR